MKRDEDKSPDPYKVTMVVFFVIFIIGFSVGRWSVSTERSCKPFSRLSLSGSVIRLAPPKGAIWT